MLIVSFLKFPTNSEHVSKSLTKTSLEYATSLVVASDNMNNVTILHG